MFAFIVFFYFPIFHQPIVYYFNSELLSHFNSCLINRSTAFYYRRWTRGGLTRGQISLDAIRRQGIGRAGHFVQLPEDGDNHRDQRVQSVGDRASMLPDDHDAHGPHPPGGVHGFPQEVCTRIMLPMDKVLFGCIFEQICCAFLMNRCDLLPHAINVHLHLIISIPPSRTIFFYIWPLQVSGKKIKNNAWLKDFFFVCVCAWLFFCFCATFSSSNGQTASDDFAVVVMVMGVSYTSITMTCTAQNGQTVGQTGRRAGGRAGVGTDGQQLRSCGQRTHRNVFFSLPSNAQVGNQFKATAHHRPQPPFHTDLCQSWRRE